MKKPRGFQQSLDANGPGRTPGAPEPKPPPDHKWLWLDSSKSFGVIEIEGNAYFYERLSTNVFLLRRPEGHKIIQYTVMANGYCGCDGYMYTRHCKHAEVFSFLREKGEV